VVDKVLIKSFVFEKALMKEHFNENYLESDKYPIALLKGKVANLDEVNFAQDGTYEADIEGELTMHGITRPISEKGTFEVKGNQITGKSKFTILLADYEVKIPSTVADNIAKEIEISVDVVMDKVVE
jgi:polyisoprenoid-binding protein YceI